MDGQAVLRLLRNDGQPFIFVQVAVTIASSPDDVRQLLSWVTRTSKPPRPLPPPPPLSSWLPLYRSHRSLQNGIGMALGVPDNLSNDVLDSFRGLHRVPHEELQEEIAQLDKSDLENFIRLFVGVPFPPDDATLGAMLSAIDSKTDPARVDDDQIDAILIAPTGQFYFRVWLPCWILYRHFPAQLLRKAREGDLDALDKLLRLDKSVVHDPRIAERVHQLTHTGAKRDRDRILEALKGKPKVHLDAKTLRYGLAGMISQLAFLFRTRVTAPEIAQLFDAIERIRSGNQTDTRIATGETFAKAIQRNRNWPSLRPR